MNDAMEIMDLLLKTHTEDLPDDDPQTSYLISAWARICKILGKSGRVWIISRLFFMRCLTAYTNFTGCIFHFFHQFSNFFHNFQANNSNNIYPWSSGL